jgi:hypothetical protein
MQAGERYMQVYTKIKMKNISLKQNSSFHQFVIEITLKELKKYQSFFEDFLEKEKQTLEKSYREKISKLEYDDMEEFGEIAQDYHYKHSDVANTFPHNFRASFLIQIVTFIETTLTEICEHYELANNTNYSIHDIRGNSDIEKAKIFLTKSCGANFDNLNPEWQFILIAKKLRNSLIHYQGHIKKSEKDWLILNSFNGKNDYFKFSPIGENVESPRFILKNKKLTEKLLTVTEIFFNKLLKEIDY